ncbi:MAG: hypothetical protein KDK34_11060, partial [Leptospiraceae bacterium]|nr:hypothetical protein [Leptospiraceae bacterium]
ETDLLASWFRQDQFADSGMVAGFELEAWLVNERARPAPCNARVLERLNDDHVVSELAQFNIELNTTPRPIQSRMLADMQAEAQDRLLRCQQAARLEKCRLALIGILPTVANQDMVPENMSALERYHALNEQVLRLRGGRPIELNIQGKDLLHVTHNDVMLESATTSLQIHLQIPPHLAVRYYNASLLASAFMAAVCANSPYLFGHDLWSETRIPLFEQAVDARSFSERDGIVYRRVSFGTGYAVESLLECFEENVRHHDILLPCLFDEPDDQLMHLRLHNGTIWRWNRPLVAPPAVTSDGRPHLRIEHRVPAAGPTVTDMVANIALFIGMVHAFIQEERPLEQMIPFAHARQNFYNAARDGLHAGMVWRSGDSNSIN